MNATAPIAPEKSVAAEVLAGGGIALELVPRRLPVGARGKRISTSTVRRWAEDGVLVEGGRRVRLETARLGSTRYTSEAALRRFVEELSSAT